MKFYSQFGQDKFLYENYFSEIKNGFFIDIGAHDGVTGNNTYFFELMGWDGICIEPIPSVFDKLKNNRKCRLENCALSNKNEKVKFLELVGYTEMLSGILENYPKQHLDRIDREIKQMGGQKKIIECNTKKFEDLKSNKKINYLSLDVEGSELLILGTIDFDNYSIDFLSVENNYNDPNINNLLISKGYKIIKNLGCDLIFKKI